MAPVTARDSHQRWTWGAVALVAVMAMLLAWPGIKARMAAARAPIVASMAVDWDGVAQLIGNERRNASEIAEALRKAGVGWVLLRDNAPATLERDLRASGLGVVWRVSDADLSNALERFGASDGVMFTGSTIAGYPAALLRIADTISDKHLFLPHPDLVHQRGLRSLGLLARDATVRTHVLGSAEMLGSDVSRWQARLLRAVRERSARFLAVGVMPLRSWEENLAFFEGTRRVMVSRGIRIAAPPETPASVPHGTSTWGGIRVLGVFVVAVTTPVLGLWAVLMLRLRSPGLAFVVLSGVSLIGGVVVSVVISDPELFLGLRDIRGVKLMLLAPFLLAVGVLTSPDEWRALLDTPVRGRHLLWGALIGGVALGGMLLRSGNDGALLVTESERSLRDAMDALFGARPRFKEFLIGHPLVILGFYVRSRAVVGRSVLRSGRIWLLIGLLGQVSIINTFLHPHAPLDVQLLRTFHGLWMGVLAAAPLCLAYKKYVSNAELEVIT